MAILYRFAPRDRRLEPVNLLQYEQRITGVVEEVFDENLKDVHVYETYFEFTLERSVPLSSLLKMGRHLQSALHFSYHFRRQAVEMYALVTREEDSFSVSFLDRTVCELSPQALAERVRTSRGYREEAGEWANLVNYLTLYTVQLNEESVTRFFPWAYILNEHSENGSLFRVRLQHRRIEVRPQEESDFSFSYNSFPESFFVFDHLYTGDRDYGKYADLARLISCEPARDDRIAARIRELLSLEGAHIPPVPPALLSTRLPSGKHPYVFRVHNVGQGLATSLEYNKTRILYFDFGIACGRNIKTLPLHVDLAIAKNGVIILSHTDEDHWCGFRKEPLGLSATWIIPRQRSKAPFAKAVAAILLNHGKVYYNNPNGLSCGDFIVAHAGSTLRPGRNPHDFHQTGYAMYLHGKDSDGNSRNIAISGDQDYDYQPQAQLHGLHLLVACHHGGKYSWSRRCSLPAPADDSGRVVYSYGVNNSYMHPSETRAYELAGWNDRVNTPDGDYFEEITISLR